MEQRNGMPKELLAQIRERAPLSAVSHNILHIVGQYDGSAVHHFARLLIPNFAQRTKNILQSVCQSLVVQVCLTRSLIRMTFLDVYVHNFLQLHSSIKFYSAQRYVYFSKATNNWEKYHGVIRCNVFVLLHYYNFEEKSEEKTTKRAF